MERFLIGLYKTKYKFQGKSSFSRHKYYKNQQYKKWRGLTFHRLNCVPELNREKAKCLHFFQCLFLKCLWREKRSFVKLFCICIVFLFFHSVSLSICLSVSLSIYPLSIWPCLSVCLSIHPSIHSSIHLSIFLSFFLSFLRVLVTVLRQKIRNGIS